ncbi:MAG: hypothetical protein RIQ60_3445 [Pseudomonadota bacterium]|jgi:DNA polymerase-3 subunit alpha
MTTDLQPFVHLRLHTEYSVSEGILRIDEAAAAARASAQPALAITDLANLFGAVKFYKTCRKNGVQPILGAEVELVMPLGAEEVTGSVLLLVTSNAGYLNLCRLLSVAWSGMSQAGSGGPRLPYAALQASPTGLLVLSGGQRGLIGTRLLAGETANAQTLATQLARDFVGSFYIELQRYESGVDERYNAAAAALAVELGVPVVATHPIQFLAASDFDAHEARACVSAGEILANPRRVRRYTADQYFKTSAEMAARFADAPQALANTVAIARRCHIDLVLGKPQLPDFPTPILPDGTPMPMADYFRQASFDGLEQRLAALFPDEAERARVRPDYVARLEFEINTILKMDFPGYFLIVSDFINWAKSHGCPVGPGRGSGAGSLVAYALSITDLDPLKFKLLFERFLNPERVSMPDFDIDFCQANRESVIDYVKAKYGRDAVSQIATFGTMAAKAAIRDIGRVLGMGYGYVDSIAKLIPAPPGKTVTLAKVPDEPDGQLVYARKEAPELEAREAKEEEVAELLSLAARVEGMVRNVGMHAGGVLIAPGKITDFCPLYQQDGSDSLVSQFDKDDVEAIGLVKFDFLGLATLTILEEAKRLIVKKAPRLAAVLYEGLPFDDRKVYELFSAGLTEAVFQFESPGMQRMLKDAKPSRLEDLIALNALYRPGPMDLIPSFVARKHGREVVEYPHDLVEPVLAETYGIMVYQEQVMQTAQVLGGYSLGGADLLRRAMGKKKVEEMAAHRKIFREGAAKNDIDEAKADEIFDLMEKFAGYGFNKSHAAAYSVLAYHTAWVKVNFPAEFYCANMTVEMGDTDKLRVLRDDAAKFGLGFQIPSINRGVLKFEPEVGRNEIIYGLGAVKGTGAAAIEAIVAERERGGAYSSFFDFCTRIDRSRINKRVVEALIKAGAFDEVHPLGPDGRAQLLASVSLGFEYADAQQRNAMQSGLFDADDGLGSLKREPDYPAAPVWDVKQRLEQEKQAIGYFLSGHLFDQNATEVRKMVGRQIGDASDSRESVLLAGIVSGLRVVNGQRGRAAIFKLDDKSGAVEAVAAEELLDRRVDVLVDDALLICSGQVRLDRFNGGLRFNVQDIQTLDEARRAHGRFIRVRGVKAEAELFAWAQQFAAAALAPAPDAAAPPSPPPGLRVLVDLQIDGAQCVVDLGESLRVNPTDAAVALRSGSALAVEVVYGGEAD